MQPAGPPPVWSPPMPGSTRLPLRRPTSGRVLGGVAMGVAAHLDLPLRLVRAVLGALALLGGAGVALYVFLWVTVPTGDPAAAAGDARPAALTRLARTQGLGQDVLRRLPVTDIAIGLVLLAGAAVLVAVRTGTQIDTTWVVPLVLLLAGTGLAWSQLDAVQRGRWRSRTGGRTPVSVLRLVGGLVLAGVGVLLLVAQDAEPAAVLQATIAAVAVLAGVALVLAPWWLRLVRELGDERAARARESERADIAAHLHDSVLQTLALIRARSDDPTEVARMARAQERELREWLYDDRPAPGTSVVAALRAIVAEVEDSRTGPSGEPVAVDTVVVGDRVPDAQTEALLQATREALVNAVVHGRPPVSLYLEVGLTEVDVFVRDRGEGFDVEEIPPDRFGVRESIMGRVRRRGGTASVESKEGRGTEVHLSVPVYDEAARVPQEETQR